MKLVVDTSVVIAVITNEQHKRNLIQITRGAELIAPSSLHWEIGNAFSSMFKRNLITIDEARKALALYKTIPIHFIDVDIYKAIEIAKNQNIYAYDSYFIVCAIDFNSSLLSLDSGLVEAARNEGVSIIEVPV